MTLLYGVVGDPVSHSLSPVIHKAWIREHGIDATYEALHVAKGELDEGLKTLESRGAKGLNITLPHKEKALSLSETVSDVARRIGAANTLIHLKKGGWHAENTDAPGFAETLGQIDIDISGQHVCLLGAGGAARAVALAISDMRAELTICNRTVSRAEEMTNHLNIEAEICSLDQAVAAMGEADIVINTLSLGHSGGALEMPDGKSRIFYDISYGKAAKPMLDAASAQDWKPVDGIGMLVAQAAFSFEHWFGVLPDMVSAQERCRKLVEATT
ncbi:shikimate dehydrogenase [Hyphomonas pacifica]|uniref:Shikimate dehydrogenase (NADP(+)) n=1 Tax=Hyphomonas pacifica TaxID=1280941 RepID=A0A062TT42_9PROT|nr:shikimate dehydrogenase [Hyphomonas pacifica]KCZ51121.1 hypothetical protein HY2_12355 [Hyphomonas pacifica]RAN33580.1 hypothetical protein HY3_12455 [Hyphomonas pacifica]RAN37060.1 hypothetical protein HY11_10655 [Hyphomonas pacifica]